MLCWPVHHGHPMWQFNWVNWQYARDESVGLKRNKRRECRRYRLLCITRPLKHSLMRFVHPRQGSPLSPPQPRRGSTNRQTFPSWSSIGDSYQRPTSIKPQASATTTRKTPEQKLSGKLPLLFFGQAGNRHPQRHRGTNGTVSTLKEVLRCAAAPSCSMLSKWLQ